MNLNKLINFNSPWHHQNIYGILKYASAPWKPYSILLLWDIFQILHKKWSIISKWFENKNVVSIISFFLVLEVDVTGVVIRESRRGFELPRLNLMLSWTFSGQSKKLKKITVQSVIWNFRAAYRIFKKGHFWLSFSWKYRKITLFLGKRLFCEILRGAASDYGTLISFGLFLAIHFLTFEIEIIVKFISRDYANVHYSWILSTLNFVDFILIPCTDTFPIAKNVNMYFFLLTNTWITFDEALALLDRLKKAIPKITKGATFWKQSLGNIFFKMLYFKVNPYC